MPTHVDRLVERGLIVRRADPADGRGVLLTLSEEGAAIQRRVGARHAADVARVVGERLRTSELHELACLTAKLATSGDAPEAAAGRPTQQQD